MYSKLIICLDGSRLSESILPYARTIVKAFDVPVELLQAIDPETIQACANPGSGLFLDVVEADLRRYSKDYLDSMKDSLGTKAVNCVVEVGNPAEVIVERAERDAEALVAMSTHGHSGFKRWYMGSVADKVLHASRSPLLVVRGREAEASRDDMANIKHLLLPLDGSPLAEMALPHAVTLAKALSTDLELMRVYTPLTQAYYGEGFIPNYDEMTEMLRADAQEYLEEKASTARAEGLDDVKCIVEEGDAAGEIIDVAKKMDDNLVVMSSHGRSGVSRWVLGGTADRVVRYSEDPVLIIRAPEQERV